MLGGGLRAGVRTAGPIPTSARGSRLRGTLESTLEKEVYTIV